VFYTYTSCAFPEHDPKRVETLWTFNTFNCKLYTIILCILLVLSCTITLGKLHFPKSRVLYPVNIMRQEMLVWRNIEARSHNHCCLEKAISVSYCKRVSVFLPQLQGMHSACASHLSCAILYCHCGPSGSAMFFHIISYLNGTIFEEKSYWAQNVCFDFLYNVCRCCNYRILMKLEFPWQNCEKSSNIIFHESVSSAAELFQADGRTDMTKLLSQFANASKKIKQHLCLDL